MAKLSLPIPKPNQVWRSPRVRVTPRKVLDVVQRRFSIGVVVEGAGTMTIGTFHRWARDAGARPVE